MAQPNEPVTAEPENTPLQDPFATPLTVNDLEDEAENPDEWEYEYSTTETETYYLTLDLTTPDVAPKTRTKRSAGTGGTKAKWLNPALGRVKRKNAVDRSEDKAASLKRGTQVPVSEAQTPHAGADIDDEAPVSPECTGSQGDAQELNVEPAKVQIMGLHTRNPFASYNGHVYSCQWASNIGTELLFTEHDPDSSLPVLRNLPGNVDLLAASSARIISNSVSLEPKPGARTQPEPKKRMDKSKKDHALSIPVGHTASEQRKGQARFLERLMEIKEAKGEEDDVTVYTNRRLSRNGWKKHLEEKRQAERKTLQRIVKANKKRDKNKVEDAKVRLEELDVEEESMKEAERKWLGVSRPQGKGRIPGFGGDGAAESRRKRVRVDDDGEQGSIFDTGTPKESVSTPMPQGWEMEGNGENFEGDDVEDYGYDEAMAEEIFYEDEYGDEDAPGEDEDTQLAYGWS